MGTTWSAAQLRGGNEGTEDMGTAWPENSPGALGATWGCGVWLQDMLWRHGPEMNGRPHGPGDVAWWTSSARPRLRVSSKAWPEWDTARGAVEAQAPPSLECSAVGPRRIPRTYDDHDSPRPRPFHSANCGRSGLSESLALASGSMPDYA